MLTHRGDRFGVSPGGSAGRASRGALPRRGRWRRLGRSALLAVLWLALLAAAQDQPVGQRYTIRASDMPASFTTPVAANPPRQIGRPEDATLQVPPGFRANLFATGLEHARWMAVADNGDVLLAEPSAGRITLLRDADGDGRAELIAPFLEDLERPHGLAIHDGYLYVGEPARILRVAYTPGDAVARAAPEPVTARGAFEGVGHITRNIAFAPGTADLYVVVNERAGLGDDLVPDYLTRVVPGGFYGWPYAYIGPNPDPQLGEARPDLVTATIVHDLLFESHSAPLGLVFYDAAQFPAEYRGDAFVALH